MTFDMETLNSFVEVQLEKWPLARKNFDRLREVERKPFRLGDLEGAVQYNPGRIRSTGADVSPEAVKKRACFLCSANRPPEQDVIPILPGWELLVNPFPILPIHFTIVSKDHKPQGQIPVDMVSIADLMPGMAVFFNGARAGASAPDHLHLQAVLKSELPLLNLVENTHKHTHAPIETSGTLGLDVPFHFVSAVIRADAKGMAALRLMTSIRGTDANSGLADKGLVNVFFWQSGDGLLRAVVIPRKAHRPQCYGDNADSLMVSPGAIDMAGIIITPREADFRKLDSTIIGNIYSETAFTGELPDKIWPASNKENH